MFRDAGKCFRHQWIESMILSIEYIWFRKSFRGLPGRGDAPGKRGGCPACCATPSVGRPHGPHLQAGRTKSPPLLPCLNWRFK